MDSIKLFDLIVEHRVNKEKLIRERLCYRRNPVSRMNYSRREIFVCKFELIKINNNSVLHEIFRLRECVLQIIFMRIFQFLSLMEYRKLFFFSQNFINF